MRNRMVRLGFVMVSLGLLVYSLTGERHDVRSLATQESQQLGGMQFVAGTTTEDFLLRDGGLYDARSLLPSWASIKDCKT